MKKTLRATAMLLLTASLSAAPFSLAPSEGKEARLGDTAAANGDYRGAAAAYRRALQEDPAAAKASRLRLALASALLRCGDIAGAKAMLAEFRRLYPHASVGLLPGEISAAEGRFEDALRFFTATAEDPEDPEELRLRARFAKARLLLHLDAPGEALADLSALRAEGVEVPPEIRDEVEPEYIYALIRAGKCDEAAKVLAGRPADSLRLELLELYRKLQAGGTPAEFVAGWEKLRGRTDPHPDDLVRRVLDDAAQQAQRRKDPDAAQRCWTDAFHFSASDAERRDALRNIFYCRRAVDAAAAAETAKQYRRFFPDAPDRAQLLLSAAQLLVAEGKNAEALELFELVTSDRGVSRGERLDAARRAADAAEKSREYPSARRMLDYLERESKGVDERADAVLLCGEYLFRRKEYREAARRAVSLLRSRNRAVADRAAFLLLRVRIECGEIAEALKIAEELKDSPTAEYAAYADYQNAALAEAQGDFAAARKRYLGFLLRFPDNTQYKSAAHFAAAQLAERGGDFVSAAKEFRSFATEYPTDPSVPSALFLAVRGACLADNRDLAEEALEQLLSRCPAAAPERAAGLLCFAQYLRRLGAFDDEEKLLARLPADAGQPAERAAMMLEKVRLLRARQRDREAVAMAKTLLAEYPSSDVAADAALLAGDLLCDLGEYSEAQACFERAKTLRPAGLFGEIAEGRRADCIFARGGDKRDDAQLKQAAEIYTALAEHSRFPAIRLRSRFKAGHCREQLGETDAAVNDYEEVLNEARRQRADGGNPEIIWCSQAAYAAMNLLIDGGERPDRLQRASRIAARYRALGAAAAADTNFRKLSEEIRNYYNQWGF